MKDADRFTISLQNAEGRLSYKTLTAKPEPIQYTQTEQLPILRRSSHKSVHQIKDGEIIAAYNSLKEAERITGINKAGISRSVIKTGY